MTNTSLTLLSTTLSNLNPTSLSTATLAPTPSTHCTSLPLPFPLPLHALNNPPPFAANSTSRFHSSSVWYPYFWMRASWAGSRASNALFLVRCQKVVDAETDEEKGDGETTTEPGREEAQRPRSSRAPVG
ncbi:hypothetical protein GTA08_BOTSDO13298 [Neofusicoccum parvum]|nr:hypothetical protein GTA08_BOTSDO13298 [Neofusicoccum parvum]